MSNKHTIRIVLFLFIFSHQFANASENIFQQLPSNEKEHVEQLLNVFDQKRKLQIKLDNVKTELENEKEKNKKLHNNIKDITTNTIDEIKELETKLKNNFDNINTKLIDLDERIKILNEKFTKKQQEEELKELKQEAIYKKVVGEVETEIEQKQDLKNLLTNENKVKEMNEQKIIIYKDTPNQLEISKTLYNEAFTKITELYKQHANITNNNNLDKQQEQIVKMVTNEVLSKKDNGGKYIYHANISKLKIEDVKLLFQQKRVIKGTYYSEQYSNNTKLLLQKTMKTADELLSENSALRKEVEQLKKEQKFVSELINGVTQVSEKSADKTKQFNDKMVQKYNDGCGKYKKETISFAETIIPENIDFENMLTEMEQFYQDLSTDTNLQLIDAGSMMDNLLATFKLE